MAGEVRKLFTILLLIPIVSLGQKKDSVINFGQITSFGTSNILTIPAQLRVGSATLNINQDTVKVLMLVCDTSGTSGIYGTIDGGSLWWRHGYEVRKFPERYGDTRGVKYIEDSWYGFIIPDEEYLDQNKKPLQKSIIVWMTKEIK